MSLHEAYAAPHSALGWRTEAAARLRDFLERRVGHGLETAWEGVERAFSRQGIRDSRQRIRGALLALKGWLRERRESGSTDAAEVELATLVERILDEQAGIENYSQHLFTVDSPF